MTEVGTAPVVKRWWHGMVAYQIYPRSFKDSNGDGVGDLRGIIEKLGYIASLGVDIIWISPIFVSPFIDNGYDVADYRNISPVYGTLEDFDELLVKAKELGLYVILDLVVNHCSDQHPLFRKALSDPQAPEREFFYFVKGHNDAPPDNLRSYFGGSVWERVPGEDNLYYLHTYAKEQPDFNWYNPRLRERIYEMINWWLDRGVAGFRIDAIMNIVKDTSFKGLPPDEQGDGSCAAAALIPHLAYTAPVLLDELKARTFGHRDAFTVAEAFGLGDDVIGRFIGDDGCFSTVFDFTARQSIDQDRPGYYAYPQGTIKLYRDGNFSMQKKSNALGFVAPLLENHDEPRAVSFYLKPHQRNPQGAKALATVFMFLRGIPFIYQGQELGMTSPKFESIDEFDDLQTHDEYHKALRHGLTPQEALALMNVHSRDLSRTPMIWDDGPAGGFTTGTPWIRTHQDIAILNARAQECDPASVLNHYRALIRLRRDPQIAPCVTYGRFEEVAEAGDEVICYRRFSESVTLEVAANFSDEEIKLILTPDSQVLLSSGDGANLNDGILTLAPLASCVVTIK